MNTAARLLKHIFFGRIFGEKEKKYICIMKTLRYLTLFLVPILTGCIEIIDDLSINEDGSGTFKYTINLSSSKVKVNSILALDSLDGKKIPTTNDISMEINEFIEQLKNQEGIYNVTMSSDFDNFIFKFSCDFTSLEYLQKGLKLVIKEQIKTKEIDEIDYHWLTFEDDVLKRSIPTITVKKAQEINREDSDLLRSGSYTSITRFYTEVSSSANVNSVISKNRRAVMVKTDPFSLIQNQHILDNTISLSK